MRQSGYVHLGEVDIKYDTGRACRACIGPAGPGCESAQLCAMSSHPCEHVAASPPGRRLLTTSVFIGPKTARH